MEYKFKALNKIEATSKKVLKCWGELHYLNKKFKLFAPKICLGSWLQGNLECDAKMLFKRVKTNSKLANRVSEFQMLVRSMMQKLCQLQVRANDTEYGARANVRRIKPHDRYLMQTLNPPRISPFYSNDCNDGVSYEQ